MATMNQSIRRLNEQRAKYDMSRTWVGQLREEAAQLRIQAAFEIRRGHLESATLMLDRAERAEREADGWELEGAN